ncbi:MAG TPA: low specificity L-threonine aldolase [Pyrinomonadaceae bacterium]|jgi:threonine aldolase|nr:low specificity L-threonine aldolase [Pyrinomonadaceae bacterium]
MSAARRSFASDNNAGVHPRIMRAIEAANAGHVVAYGDDAFTVAALEKFREHFGESVDVHFVFGGTGANVLGLKSMTRPHQAIICTTLAHINVDECGAPENFTGCKLLTVETSDGKLTPEQVKSCLHGLGDQHHVQPKVVSISQATELGTVYTPLEILKLAQCAHDNGLLLHMDGARIANAAASLNVSLKELTLDAGLDALSFGGTKNGMMYGEAVVFFKRDLAPDFKFIRKQGMQLASKMRFISAQFTALLSDGLWLETASHANRMAGILAAEIERLPQLKITRRTQANAVFVRLPPESIPLIQREYFFYVWDEETSEVRLMASFDTTEDDIRDLVSVLKRALD